MVLCLSRPSGLLNRLIFGSAGSELHCTGRYAGWWKRDVQKLCKTTMEPSYSTCMMKLRQPTIDSHLPFLYRTLHYTHYRNSSSCPLYYHDQLLHPFDCTRQTNLTLKFNNKNWLNFCKKIYVLVEKNEFVSLSAKKIISVTQTLHNKQTVLYFL